MSAMPRISVVIPAYNSEAFIGEALDSVLAQTLRPNEIIVVDDGSTDNTREIVGRYSKWVMYFYQDNAGSAKARNTGIKHATGELIAFLDSDDVWKEKHLELIYEALIKDSQAGMVYGSRRWIDQDGHSIKDESGQTRYPSGWIFRDLFEANYIGSASAVLAYRIVICEVGGFNESSLFRNAQDYDLWLRISARYRIISEPEAEFLYRRHNRNRTLDECRRVRGLLAALNNAVAMIKGDYVRPENRPDLINTRERMKRVYTHAMVSLFWTGAYEDVREIGLEAIRKNYINSQILIRFLISFLPDSLVNSIRGLRRRLFRAF